MLLFLILFAAQAAAPPTNPDDIVVTARRMERLKRLRMITRHDGRTGVTHCVFKRRSGDPALDTAVCDAVLACVPKAKTVDEMRGCIAPTMDRLVAKGVPWRAKGAD